MQLLYYLKGSRPWWWWKNVVDFPSSFCIDFWADSNAPSWQQYVSTWQQENVRCISVQWPAPPPSSSDRSRLQDTGLSCASFGCTVVETKCIRCLVWRNSQRAEGEDDGTFCLIWEKTVWNQMSDSETVLRRRILLVWASTDCPLTCIFWSEELYIQKPEPMSWFKSEE